ncbi:MAG: penicillin-binding protein 1C [Bdellovibrionota bacterium]
MMRLRSRLKSAILPLLFLSLPARAANLPSFAQVRERFQSSEGRLLDREGRLLQEQRLTWNGRVLEWTPLSRVSPALINAVISVEDHRFREHAGVDFRAMAAAAWQNLAHGTKRGASTITMQTVSLLDAAAPIRRGRRDLWEKVRQTRLAWELEGSWSKDEILEAYLNLVGFRGEYRGVNAAARALFGKDPHGLDLKESHLVATLLRAPGMSAAAAGKRLCSQAKELPDLGSCDSLKEFALATLSHAAAPAIRAQLAPHLACRLLSLEEREVRSSVDLSVQLAAMHAVHDQLSSLRDQNARDAAVIVASNRTGEVLAYVGGAGSFSASPEVDMAESRRQAGSTLKPFLYGLAFHKNYLNPDSWLLDEPFEIGLDRGSYEPDNYDHLFHGPVPAKVALASSLNIPAVRVVGLVGVDDFQDLLDRAGFRELEAGEHYGPSLALGTADITLFDLVQAYLALANEGKWMPLHLRAGEAPGPTRRILSKKAANQVAAILSDRGFRSLTFGWDSLLATPYPAAVKTGTSKDMRDNWCVGFTRDYTVGVWVGNSGGQPMWAVSGISGAAPVWRSVMDALQRGLKAKALPLLAPGGNEFERGQFGKILYPPDGAILAVDPDIPPAHQRVLLEASGDGKLSLDGEPLGDPLWKPVPGKHRLRLSDASGAVLDELGFEVR